MKQFLVIVSFTLFSTFAFATGKLSVQGNWYNDGQAVRPMVGLSVYEKLFVDNIHLNAWTGYGTQFLETNDDVNWYIAKAQIDIRNSRLTYAPGVLYKRLVNEQFEDVIPYLRLDYQLW